MKRRIQQLRNKCQILLENSHEIVLFFNETGNIVECNQAAKNQLGYGDEINDISVTDIFHKAIKLIDHQLIINLKFQDRIGETIAYRKNQTCFAVELRIAMAPWSKTFRGVCMAVDISERKKIQRDLKLLKTELKTNRRIKNDFVANITHELRTPVNGIMGLTEYLLETELNPNQLDSLHIIHRCCQNMNGLINDLLDFAKIGNNKLVLEQREFNFCKFIDDLIAFNINRITKKGLKLIVNIADDIPCRVIGDEQRLTQVLNNLFSNAIKFTSVGQIALEVVRISQEENEIELFFMVMDTGIGISVEEKDKLFLSFSQVDSSITRRFGGTGLGLSICRMLVEAMNGKIAVESEKDKGSTFSFSVKLGVPQQLDSDLEQEQYNCYHKENGRFSDENHLVLQADIDYKGETQKATDVDIQELKLYNSYLCLQEDQKPEHMIRNSIEKLKLCIEMENWEKAEETAVLIKKLMPMENQQLNNKALQLVLTIRKEEYNKSMTELEELENYMNEVAIWNV